MSGEAQAIPATHPSHRGASEVVRAAVARLATAGEASGEAPRAARWRVLDRFDHDGHRYALVVLEDRSARKLSPREAEVLARAAAGQTNKEISYELGLAWSTVRVLVHRARRKQAFNALHAAAEAQRLAGSRSAGSTPGSAGEP
jgi:DNA-binding NarL/FixJ family response regulator